MVLEKRVVTRIILQLGIGIPSRRPLKVHDHEKTNVNVGVGVRQYCPPLLVTYAAIARARFANNVWMN